MFAGLARWGWVQNRRQVQQLAVLEVARSRFPTEGAQTVLPGAPPVWLERARDGDWRLRIPWPTRIPGGLPDTTTPGVYTDAVPRGFRPTPDGVVVRWTEPTTDPLALAAELRRVWHRFLEPTPEELAHGILHGPPHLRVRNLRAWHQRDPQAAGAFARTHLGPEAGPAVWQLALPIAGALEPAIAAMSTPTDPAVRCAAIHYLATHTEPDALLSWAAVCQVDPATAVAFAKGLADHPSPTRAAWLRDFARRSVTDWPLEASITLLNAHVAGVPADDEAELLQLLRSPRAVAEQVVARLGHSGTSAAIAAIRARVDYGAVSKPIADAAIRKIRARASPKGAVSIAVATGGGLSLPLDEGRLSTTDPQQSGAGRT